MGQILKVLGGLSALYYLASQAASGIASQVRYTIGAFRRGDFRMDLVGGQPVGSIRVRMFITQDTGVTIAAQGLRLQLTQAGQQIGQVRLNNLVTLPSGEETAVEFDIIIPASHFLDRLTQIIESPVSQWFAPVTMQGWVTLSNGWELPVRHTIKIFN